MATYQYPAIALLGSSKTGKTGTMGYRLVDLTGTVILPFTTAGVAETGVPGNYVVSVGVAMPVGFVGRIIWGLSGVDYAEEEVLTRHSVDPVIVGGGVSDPISGAQ